MEPPFRNIRPAGQASALENFRNADNTLTSPESRYHSGKMIKTSVKKLVPPTASLVLCLSALAQQTSAADYATLNYRRHGSAWLCRKAVVCSGDLCGRRSDYGFDENFDVVLRDNQGKELESKSPSYEKSTFCFDARGDGD
jgi:hypothetical protein